MQHHLQVSEHSPSIGEAQMSIDHPLVESLDVQETSGNDFAVRILALEWEVAYLRQEIELLKRPWWVKASAWVKSIMAK